MPIKYRTPSKGPNWNPDGSYKVGKGKPPVGKQFQKGQSGNPKGTRKEKPDLDTVMITLMEKMVSVSSPQGGKTQMTHLTALAHKLYEKAVKGDLKAATLLLELYAGAVNRRSAKKAPDEDQSAEDQQLLDDMLRMFTGEVQNKEGRDKEDQDGGSNSEDPQGRSA